MVDLPCLLSDGAIFIGGIVGKDSRVDVNGSARIWSSFLISEGIETAGNLRKTYKSLEKWSRTQLNRSNSWDKHRV
jgi:hypothetical protein